MSSTLEAIANNNNPNNDGQNQVLSYIFFIVREAVSMGYASQ